MKGIHINQRDTALCSVRVVSDVTRKALVSLSEPQMQGLALSVIRPDSLLIIHTYY